MSSEYGVFYGDNLLNYPAQKVPIIEHILYENDVICISSKPGTGKSVLAKQWLCNLTTGNDFLDTYKVSREYSVLYIQTEGDRSETIERLEQMSGGLNVNNSNWVHINQPGLMINTTVGFSNLMKLALEPKMIYDVIILDPLYTTVKGSMKEDSVATDWVRNMRTFKGRFGKTALVILHHTTKDVFFQGNIVEKDTGDIYGSTFWGAFVNQNFQLKQQGGVHYLERGKQRSGRIVDKVAMKMLEPRPLMYVNDDANLDIGTAKVSKVLKEGMQKMTAKQIHKQLDVSQATVYRALQKLLGNNLVTNETEGKESYYVWKD